MSAKVLFSVLVLFSLLTACNLQVGQVPATPPAEIERVSSDVDAVGTAVEMTAAARLTEIAGSVPATPTADPNLILTPTPCSPSVMSTVDANVRSGPGTAYGVVGALLLGRSATIVGRNDAYTWWYIDYPSAAGGHAWIAGSVVTTACVPPAVQVVAAPPLPTEEPVVAASSSDDSAATGSDSEGDTATLEPVPFLMYAFTLTWDLVPVSMQFSPDPAIKDQPLAVTVTIENQGTGTATNFTVQWWAKSSELGCSWTVDSLAGGASTVLSCPYIYHTSMNQNVKLVVDSGGAVAEANEDNNTLRKRLSIRLH